MKTHRRWQNSQDQDCGKSTLPGLYFRVKAWSRIVTPAESPFSAGGIVRIKLEVDPAGLPSEVSISTF